MEEAFRLLPPTTCLSSVNPPCALARMVFSSRFPFMFRSITAVAFVAFAFNINARASLIISFESCMCSMSTALERSWIACLTAFVLNTSCTASHCTRPPSARTPAAHRNCNLLADLRPNPCHSRRRQPPPIILSPVRPTCPPPSRGVHQG